MIFNDLIY